MTEGTRRDMWRVEEEEQHIGLWRNAFKGGEEEKWEERKEEEKKAE